MFRVLTLRVVRLHEASRHFETQSLHVLYSACTRRPHTTLYMKVLQYFRTALYNKNKLRKSFYSTVLPKLFFCTIIVFCILFERNKVKKSTTRINSKRKMLKIFEILQKNFVNLFGIFLRICTFSVILLAILSIVHGNYHGKMALASPMFVVTLF